MKLSETVQTLLEDYEEQPLPFGLLLERTGTQGFGILSGVLALPMLIPLPVPLAGFSTLLGAGIILMGLQLALGFSSPRLPALMLGYRFSPRVSQQILKNLNRVLRPLERFAKPRLLNISHNFLLQRLLGVCLAWNAALMALPLPIPFSNLLPAYTILILVIGLLEADGLFILVGYGMTGVTTAFFASIANLIWILLRPMLERLPP